MLWACFSVSGVCTIHRIEEIITKEDYIKFLEKDFKKYAQKL